MIKVFEKTFNEIIKVGNLPFAVDGIRGGTLSNIVYMFGEIRNLIWEETEI